MKDETRTELDELMVGYERALASSKNGPSEAERAQGTFQVLCHDGIRPVMEAFAEVLREHGHTVRIYGHETAVDPGSHTRHAELMMHVTPKKGDPRVDPSQSSFVVNFSFDPVDHKMLARVTDGSSQSCRYARPFDFHPVEGVTIELVEQELLEMIHYAFECARQQRARSDRATATV